MQETVQKPGPIRAKFYAARSLPDALLQNAADAAAFFTPAEIENNTFFKLGYVVEQKQGFIMFFKYDGPRDGREPIQKILMQQGALQHMADTLAQNESPKGKLLLEEIKEGLGMAQCYGAETKKRIARAKTKTKILAAA